MNGHACAALPSHDADYEKYAKKRSDDNHRRIEGSEMRTIRRLLTTIFVVVYLLLVVVGLFQPVVFILLVVVLGPIAFYHKFINKKTRTVGSRPYVPGRDCPHLWRAGTDGRSRLPRNLRWTKDPLTIERVTDVKARYQRCQVHLVRLK
jgi:hypothetical protein